MIDVVSRYLSCGIKLLTQCAESLIANIHKIPVCAPAIHQLSAVTVTGSLPQAEVLCLQEGRSARQAIHTLRGVPFPGYLHAADIHQLVFLVVQGCVSKLGLVY